MSRIEYDDSLSDQQVALQMGRDKHTVRGKVSQAFLAELEQYLLRMNPKRLISGVLCNEDGEVCALGLVAKHRLLQQGFTHAGIFATLALPWQADDDDIDGNALDYAEQELGISRTLAWLVMEANDDPGGWGRRRTPEQRHAWVLDEVRRMQQGQLPSRFP